MAGKAQTRPGEAVYRLNFALRVPGEPDEGHSGGLSRPVKWSRKPMWLPAGYEAGAHQLAGLVLPSLEAGGFVKQIKEPEVPCEFCQTHGTKAEKAERYASPEAMNAHYKDAHPGVRSTEQF